MNRFFRKFILHKYSDQISAIGKQPVFIISDNEEIARTLLSELNVHPKLQIAENNAPFLNHIGSLAYAQFVGKESDYCKANSKFKEDKLEELLRKISFKNTFGNNYGFEINPFGGKSNAKKLKGNLDEFRWGTIINPNEEAYSGLCYLFNKMNAIYLFKEDDLNKKYNYLAEHNNCLRIKTDEFIQKKTKVLATIYGFLGIDIQEK